mgnify:CR=1 FL=1
MRAKARALVARANETYVDPYEVAATFSRAGLVDEALYWLDQAVEHGAYKITYVAFWPHLDVVREDPRYLGLLERGPLYRRSDSLIRFKRSRFSILECESRRSEAARRPA